MSRIYDAIGTILGTLLAVSFAVASLGLVIVFIGSPFVLLTLWLTGQIG